MKNKLQWENIFLFPWSVILMYALNFFLIKGDKNHLMFTVYGFSLGLILLNFFIYIKLFVAFDPYFSEHFSFSKFLAFLFSFLGLFILLLAGLEMFMAAADIVPKILVKKLQMDKIFYFGNAYYSVFLFGVLTRHKARTLPINFNEKTYYLGEKFVINPFLKFKIEPVKKELKDYFVFEFHAKDGIYKTQVDFWAEIDFKWIRALSEHQIDKKILTEKTISVIKNYMIDMCQYKTIGEIIKSKNNIISVSNGNNPSLKISEIKFRILD